VQERLVSTPAKNWQLLPHDPVAMEKLGRALGVSPIVAQLLLNRGLQDPQSARRFLDAPLQGLHGPELLGGVTESAERLLAAIAQKRRIVVYGDYDVDGTAGTAILWHGLHLLGGEVDFYVPHRLEEGYGLNCEALNQIARANASVVVTVDCGIGSLEEAEEARRIGIELIVTDHHEFKDKLPDAAVLVHPRLPGTSYPFGGLSGAGVAFKLAWALCQKASGGGERVAPRFREYLLDSLVLVALGLVADVVPCHDENRIFVRHGLARLRAAPVPGLRALLDGAGLADKNPLCAEDISFKLAPRLNAAGRLGSARLVIELLTTTSAQRAADLARYLEGQNTQRQQVERRILAEARQLAAAEEDARALVLDSADWHPGIIGIVASRLVELFARPALLIALRPEPTRGNVVIGHGSGRSVTGFALNEALEACSSFLLSHGGHAAAAGFKIMPERIEDFRTSLCEHARARLGQMPMTPRLVLDAEVPLSNLTPGFLRDLDRLEPYGAANRRPQFLASGLELVGSPTRVGGGERHLSFRVKQRGTTLRCIAFGQGERAEELTGAGGACCLAFTPKINEWQGFRRVDLEIADFQAAREPRLE
jgi:single-stranded-DNA-specific exonuclease